MNSEQFEKILYARMQKMEMMLATKAREYAKEGDRLHNFNQAAKFQNITPDQAAWNFLVKHLVSLQDMIMGGGAYSQAQWDEKIGDSMNYLVLIEAIVSQRFPRDTVH